VSKNVLRFGNPLTHRSRLPFEASPFRPIRRDVDDNSFITDIYRGLLDREPDADGMRHFSNMLKNGSLDRAGLIKSVLSSNGFKSRGAGGAEHRGTEPHGCLRSEATLIPEKKLGLSTI
jgi:hypothetical protein